MNILLSLSAISAWRPAMLEYLKTVLFTVRYNLFEVLILAGTYFATDYTFDDKYDPYIVVAAMMLLIWGAFKKLEY